MEEDHTFRQLRQQHIAVGRSPAGVTVALVVMVTHLPEMTLGQARLSRLQKMRSDSWPTPRLLHLLEQSLLPYAFRLLMA